MENAKEFIVAEDFNKLKPLSRQILLMQLANLNKKPKGHIFTRKDVMLSSIIYKMSPVCYKFLHKIFCLPSKSTILKHLHKINIHPGTSASLGFQLKDTVQSLPDKDKLCGIAWDEMAIVPKLVYDKYEGYMMGCEQFSENYTMPKIATAVLVFMVIGKQKKAFKLNCNLKCYILF